MYASIEEIRAASRNLDAIISSPDSDILAWGEEAKHVIDRFCCQDFSFEQRVTKVIRADDYILYFDKPLSGAVSVMSQTGDTVTPPITQVSSGRSVLTFGDYFVQPGKPYFLYRNANSGWPPPSDPRRHDPDYLEITGDWGYAVSREDLIVRLANEIKDKYDSHRASAVFHPFIDTVNTVSSPDATDLASAITLLNELKVDISNHFDDLGFHTGQELEEIDSSLATDEESAANLAEELKDDFNKHIANEDVHLEEDTDNRVFGSTCNPLFPSPIKRLFIKLVKRVAIRSNLDDELQFNSPYVSETTGDGYTYNLTNGTMRNLLRPEDRELLWPYVRHGRVIV